MAGELGAAGPGHAIREGDRGRLPRGNRTVADHERIVASADDEIAAILDDGDLARGDVFEADRAGIVERDQIDAGARAEQDLVAARDDDVIACAAIEHIAALVTREEVGAVAADQMVVAGAAEEHVIAGIAIDGIVAPLGAHDIVALHRVDQVVAGIGRDDLVAPRAVDGLDAVDLLQRRTGDVHRVDIDRIDALIDQILDIGLRAVDGPGMDFEAERMGLVDLLLGEGADRRRDAVGILRDLLEIGDAARQQQQREVDAILRHDLVMQADQVPRGEAVDIDARRIGEFMLDQLLDHGLAGRVVGALGLERDADRAAGLDRLLLHQLDDLVEGDEARIFRQRLGIGLVREVVIVVRADQHAVLGQIKIRLDEISAPVDGGLVGIERVVGIGVAAAMAEKNDIGHGLVSERQ